MRGKWLGCTSRCPAHLIFEHLSEQVKLSSFFFFLTSRELSLVCCYTPRTNTSDEKVKVIGSRHPQEEKNEEVVISLYSLILS